VEESSILSVMSIVSYPVVPELYRNPAFSHVAVIPAGATMVYVGGQNAVDGSGRIVGTGDLTAQARQVRKNVEAALAAAGCTWQHVVRVIVHLKAGCDPRQGYAVFQDAFAGRAAAPLVGGYLVAALAHPDYLLEVAVEAVK
jgi:enamine deaminase RidA (YjgF/YER057c/UK114 family)